VPGREKSDTDVDEVEGREIGGRPEFRR